MILWSFSVGGWGCDAMAFHKVRCFSDGLTLLELAANGDWYDGDHCPKYSLRLVVANFTIFEVEVYNPRHKENEYERDGSDGG